MPTYPVFAERGRKRPPTIDLSSSLCLPHLTNLWQWSVEEAMSGRVHGGGRLRPRSANTAPTPCFSHSHLCFSHG